MSLWHTNKILCGRRVRSFGDCHLWLLRRVVEPRGHEVGVGGEGTTAYRGVHRERFLTHLSVHDLPQVQARGDHSARQIS